MPKPDYFATEEKETVTEPPSLTISLPQLKAYYAGDFITPLGYLYLLKCLYCKGNEDLFINDVDQFCIDHVILRSDFERARLELKESGYIAEASTPQSLRWGKLDGTEVVNV